ncbi:HpcH/HpaI aldolase/citrate lyase family protein [Halomonas sp. DWK9]|uniref:HpcH/HpaI aldolase family protein n=1 Tax=Halomonas sp. DWK9 TaxID=3060155 RepID=UPI00287F7F9B|nr:HpcH/HpaI aldolase/citrate lyase family protein [Halomonas sp. DWK9]
MQVPTNTFKQALTGQKPIWGCWAGFASGYATEIVASTGFDWLLIDGEHAPNTLPSILAQLQAVAPYSTAPVVRSVNQDPALIKQLLDIGAQTLMIPMVESGDQAAALVRATRYPPQGVRGVGGGVVRATRWDGVDNYLNKAHESLCLIVQVESPKGVEHVEAIAATDGVDAVFIGPADLSVGMGYPGNPTHPEVQSAIEMVIETMHAAGKPVGILAPVEEDARRYQQLGCQFIAVGIDISLLRQGAIGTLGRYKELSVERSSRTY